MVLVLVVEMVVGCGGCCLWLGWYAWWTSLTVLITRSASSFSFVMLLSSLFCSSWLFVLLSSSACLFPAASAFLFPASSACLFPASSFAHPTSYSTPSLCTPPFLHTLLLPSPPGQCTVDAFFSLFFSHLHFFL